MARKISVSFDRIELGDLLEALGMYSLYFEEELHTAGDPDCMQHARVQDIVQKLKTARYNLKFKRG